MGQVVEEVLPRFDEETSDEQPCYPQEQETEKEE